ncbi:MAG: diguanylate cyclase [Idiomarina sp.]|nr:diguanylate cyclase [Idiomarina sp.]
MSPSEKDVRSLNSEVVFALINAMDTGVIAAQYDSDGQLIGQYFANTAAQHLLSLSSETPSRDELEAVSFAIDAELIGTTQPLKPVHSPIQEALSARPAERRDLTVKGRALSMKSKRVPLPSGELRFLMLLERDHRLFTQSADSSDLLSSEISLKDLIGFDKLMSQLSTDLINAQGGDCEPHIQRALEALGEFCHADRTYIFEFDEGITKQTNTFEWVREGITSHIDELQNIPRNALPWFFKVIETEGLFVVHDVDTIPEEGNNEQAEFNSEDIRSVICVGMYAQNRLIGFVGCDMVARKRHWTEADIRRLKLVGEMIANALQSERYLRSLRAAHEELLTANESLQELAHRDGLTGIANRRHFDEQLSHEVHRCLRHGAPLTVVLVDIDFFKPFNDHYGHIAGDHALRAVARVLSEHFRRSGELVSRFGGEEFAILLPEVEAQEASERLQDVLFGIEQMNIPHATSECSDVLTVSAGISALSISPRVEPEELLTVADKALYSAKAQGRNRVVVADHNGTKDAL